MPAVKFPIDQDVGIWRRREGRSPYQEIAFDVSRAERMAEERGVQIRQQRGRSVAQRRTLPIQMRTPNKGKKHNGLVVVAQEGTPTQRLHRRNHFRKRGSK